MKKAIPEHNDIMDQPLELGDAVALPSSNSLVIGFVDRINPKMIGVKIVGWRKHINKYPRDLIKIDQGMATLYLLKHTR